MTHFPEDVWRRICALVPHDRRQSSPTAAVFREGVAEEGRSGPNKMPSVLMMGQCPLCDMWRLSCAWFFHTGTRQHDPCCVLCSLRFHAAIRSARAAAIERHVRDLGA